MKTIIIFLIILFFIGCETEIQNTNTNIEIKAFNNALNIINTTLINENLNPISNIDPPTIITHPTDEHDGNNWIFYDKYTPEGVAGYFNPYEKNIIHVGCNKNNEADISYNVLTHECAHYILYNKLNILSHDKRFDKIPLWKESRNIQHY